MVASPATPRLVHVSLLAGRDLRDRAGGRLGRVVDVIARLGDDDYPPVTGILASVAGRQVFVPAELLAELDQDGATLTGNRLDLQPFARREQEVLLKKDVLDRQLINVDGGRLVRANEIELARLEGWWRVAGVDVGLRGIARRVLPRALAGRVATAGFLDWAGIEPFTGHVPTVRLRVPHPKLARLHPAELADLVEAASRREGAEILAAVGQDDPEREADVFEELDAGHQRELLGERSDAEVAEVLARMEADDAADAVGELPAGRRERVVALLPPAQGRKLRALAGYDAATAGGLMSPDFVCVYSQATVGEALERVRRARAPADALGWIYVMNTARRLQGAVPLADLVRAEPELALGGELRTTRRVRPDAEVEEVARLLTDYDLTAVAVVDEHERMIGVVTVDDVLEVVLPRGWRRQFGLLGGE